MGTVGKTNYFGETLIDIHVNVRKNREMLVGLTPEALEEYGRLPRGIQPRVDDVILRLSRWPEVSGAKPLVGRLVGNFRIRTGDYRIVFRVAGKKVIVWKIGDRKDVYLD